MALVRDTMTTLHTEDGEMVVRTPDELAVHGDGQRLRQVLENLLTNARTHTPTGVPIRVER